MIKENDIVKYVNLDCLPHRKNGQINWEQSVGYSIPFVYGDIYGNIDLLGYDIKNQILNVYIDGYTKLQYDTININSIKKCALGRLLHKKIIDTNPEMVSFFVEKNDTLKYSCESNIRVLLRCPYCGYEKTQIIANLYKFGFSCPRCSDGVSYPNKLMFNILKQLNINFINEITKREPGFKWVGNYRYDFYFEIDDNKYFIEMDGHFHKKDCMGDHEKVIQSDIEKDNLALEHNIKMIRIDCCYKDEQNKLSFIKNNIINSELCNILNCSSIDWDYVNKLSITSNINCSAEYWNDGYTIKEISSKIGVSEDSVRNYLKIANEICLCKYNKKLAEDRRIQSCINATSKPIVVYDNDGTINMFMNAKDLVLKSLNLYKRQFNRNSITVACNKHKKLYGYIIEYTTKEKYDAYIKQCLTIQN